MNSFLKNRLFELMKETAAAVDAFVLDELSTFSCDSLVPVEAILHLPKIRAKPRGHRARPKLRASFMRLVFELLSDRDWQAIVPLAAAGELLAVASYVIDDFLDHQEMRNGEPATWVAYGAADAIMAAQIQREVAERILLRLDIPESRIVRLVAMLNDIFYQGYLGQLIDSRMKGPCPIGDYIKRCEHIAGHFHGGLARMSAILAGAADETVGQLGALGFRHGIALQIRNDLVDYLPAPILAAAGAHALDRTPFEDFRNGKWTMPLLYAHEHGDSSDRASLASLMSNRPFSDDTAKTLTHMLLKTGAYEATLQEITAYKKMAEQILLEFSESPAREAMATLLETVENGRSYVDRLAAGNQ